MDITDTHRYPCVIANVFKFFSEPNYIKAKFEGIGARNIQIIECAPVDSGYLVKTQREIPSEVPSVLKSLLGAWNKVIQTEQWQLQDGVYRCQLEVNVVGVPVSVKGTMELRSNEEGCCSNEVKMKVTSGIPLLGGKLAEFVGGDTKKAMDAEYAFIKANLMNMF